MRSAFLFPCVAGVQRPAAGPGCHTVTWRPRAEGAVVFCITVTFLIYHFILRPEAFRMGNGGSFLLGAQHGAALHRSADGPARLAVVLSQRGAGAVTTPRLLVAYPAGLFHLYPHPGTVRRQHRRNVKPLSLQFHRHTGARVGIVARNALLAALGMFVLAYLMYFIDLGLSRLGRRMKRMHLKERD